MSKMPKLPLQIWGDPNVPRAFLAQQKLKDLFPMEEPQYFATGADALHRKPDRDRQMAKWLV